MGGVSAGLMQSHTWHVPDLAKNKIEHPDMTPVKNIEDKNKGYELSPRSRCALAAMNDAKSFEDSQGEVEILRSTLPSR